MLLRSRYNGMMQIFGNLHWLKSMAANAYLFEDEEHGWILVDTGFRGMTDPVKYLAKLGHSADALNHIFITHADVDHIGNLAKIQEQTGAQVYCGAESAELIPQGKFPKHNKWFIDSSAPLMKVRPTPASKLQLVQDGDELPFMGGLHVIATPGHTPDHHSYFSPSTGIMFTGDAIVGFGGKIDVSKPAISHNYPQARQSALKLAEFTPAIFVTGHGKPYQHSYDDLMELLLSLREG